MRSAAFAQRLAQGVCDLLNCALPTERRPRFSWCIGCTLFTEPICKPLKGF